MKNAIANLDFVRTYKKKKALWSSIMQRHAKIANGLPPQGSPDPEFDIEAPEDDLYMTAKPSFNLEDDDE